MQKGLDVVQLAIIPTSQKRLALNTILLLKHVAVFRVVNNDDRRQVSPQHRQVLHQESVIHDAMVTVEAGGNVPVGIDDIKNAIGILHIIARSSPHVL